MSTSRSWAVLAVGLLAVLSASSCSASAPRSDVRSARRADGSPERSKPSDACPHIPTGDVREHLRLVDLARREPTKANIRALDTNAWTELWAVEARMGRETPDARWWAGCRGGVENGERWRECYQQRWPDITAQPALADLVSVSCSVCRVGSLAGFNELPKLKRLSLMGTFLERPQSLQRLRGLQELTLSGTNIESAGAVRDLSRLERLTLTGHHLRELRGVGSLRGLRRLRVGGKCLRSIEPLRQLAQLEALAVITLLPRVDVVSELRSLSELEVWAPETDQLPRLEPLRELRRLHWHGRALRNLDFVAKLPELRELGITAHCVADEDIERTRTEHPHLEIAVGRRSSTCPE